MKKIVLATILIQQLVWAQSWHPLGDDDFDRASFDLSVPIGPQKLVAKNGHLYAPRVERGFLYSVPVYRFFLGKYDGSRWNTINFPTLLSSSDNIECTVDNMETPYIFLNDPNVNQAIVKTFTGDQWINLGSAISSTTSSLTKIAVGSDNLPFVLYTEGNTVKLKKFDGTNWNLLLTSTDLLPFTSIQLVLDNNNTPYVLSNYQVGSTYNCFVRKFNGSAWEEVGITGFSNRGTTIAFDTTNTPYIAVGTVLKKFSGGAWEDLPSPNAVGNYWIMAATAPRVVFNSANELFLGHPSSPPFSSTVRYDIKKFSGNAWQTLSVTDSFPINQTFDLIGNDLYVFFNGGESNGNIQVKKPVGSTLVELGSLNSFDAYNPAPYDFSICNGNPIISYKDGSKVSVRRFVDEEWIYLGAPQFSENEIKMSRIKSGNDGQIYVAYSNVMSTNQSDTKLTVKKLGASGWQAVGAINFSQSAGETFDFALSNTNEPHVLYMSGRVQKFDGTNWIYLGGSAYTGDVASRLALDGTNTPYIAYLDPSNSNRVAVKKLNGNIWEYVDQQSLNSYTFCQIPRIMFDGSNNLFLGFGDSNNKLHIKKLVNGTWQPVGPEFFTTTALSSTFNYAMTLELAVDNAGALHAIYNDYDGYRYLRM